MYDELHGNLMAHATHFSVHNETSLLLLKAADAIEDLDNRLNLHRQGKIRHWIPVTERLPEEHKMVLAYCADDDFYYISRMHKSFKDYEVTNWMPLPQPPESED